MFVVGGGGCFERYVENLEAGRGIYSSCLANDLVGWLEDHVISFPL